MPESGSQLDPVESRLVEVTARLESREREITFMRDTGFKYRLLVSVLALAVLGAGAYALYLSLEMKSAAAARELEERVRAKNQEALATAEERLRTQAAGDLKSLETRLTSQIAAEVGKLRDDVATLERREAQAQKDVAEAKALTREAIAALTAPPAAEAPPAKPPEPVKPPPAVEPPVSRPPEPVKPPPAVEPPVAKPPEPVKPPDTPRPSAPVKPPPAVDRPPVKPVEKPAGGTATPKPPDARTTAPPAGDLDGRSVVQRSKDLTTARSETAELTMKYIDLAANKEQRVRRLQSWSLQDDRAKAKKLSRFLEPADVRGVGLLTIENEGRDDDQWLYLPAMKKSKRISSSEKTDTFMGSDFTYEDMASEDLGAHAYKLLGSEMVDGAPCIVVEAVPATDKARKESGYARRTICFRQDNYFPVLTRFFNQNGTQLKEEHALDLAPVGRYWRPRKSEMVDLVKHHKTVLLFGNIKLDEGVEEGLFSLRELERER